MNSFAPVRPASRGAWELAHGLYLALDSEKGRTIAKFLFRRFATTIGAVKSFAPVRPASREAWELAPGLYLALDS